MKTLIVYLTCCAAYLWILTVRDSIIMDNPEDLMRAMFWMTAMGTCCGMIIGGLILFLCFSPFIALSEWARKELKDRDSANKQ